MYHIFLLIMPLLLVPTLSMSVPKTILEVLSPKMEPRNDKRDICITRKMISVKLLRCPMEIFLWTACYRFMLKSGMMERLTDQNTCLVAKGYTKILVKITLIRSLRFLFLFPFHNSHSPTTIAST